MYRHEGAWGEHSSRRMVFATLLWVQWEVSSGSGLGMQARHISRHSCKAEIPLRIRLGRSYVGELESQNRAGKRAAPKNRD